MIPARLGDPEGNGQWAGLQDWPLVGLHAMVLPDGRILSFGTDARGMQGGQFIYDVYDPMTGRHSTLPNTTGTDVFCSNMALDPYLDLTLMIGGDNRPSGQVNQSITDVIAYDYTTQGVAPAPSGDLNTARWYPGVLTLGTGDILAIGGREDMYRDPDDRGNDTMEILRSGLPWDMLEGTQNDRIGTNKWWYPHAWQKSDGSVIVVEPNNDPSRTYVYSVDVAGEGRMDQIAQIGWPDLTSHGASISHRTDKALMLSQSGWLVELDFGGDRFTYRLVDDLGPGREDADLSLLADGRVAITGGSTQWNDLDTAQRTVVVYDPETDSLTRGEDATVARLYHSTAILTPLGTVAAIGGGAPGPLTNLNAEMWAPDYLFDGNGRQADRPWINALDDTLHPGQGIVLNSPDAGGITRVTAVKSGAVTHARNADARFLELDFEQVTDRKIEVFTPDNPNVFTPGTWMLFAFDEDGVPSVAEMLDVDPGPLVTRGTPGEYAFGTSTYTLGTANLSWWEAKQEADRLGGRIVEFESQAENDFLQQTFGQFSRIHLGHVDLDTEGTWENVWGRDATFTNWLPGQPDNARAQDYAAIASPDGRWADFDNDASLFLARDGWTERDTLHVIEFENTRELILQTGDAAFQTRGRDDWHRVTFDTAMDDPIVVVSPPTLWGTDPGTIRVRNVDSTGFEVQFEEWEYLDGAHFWERVSWMAVERGVHTLPDGGVIEAGGQTIGMAARIGLSGDFGPGGPVVLGQIASHRGQQTVTDRVFHVTDSAFTAAMQEQQAGDRHGPEAFHWVAFSAGNHNDFSAFSDPWGVNHRRTDLDAARASAEDAFFAETQTARGWDPAVLRMLSRPDESPGLFLQEERSADREMMHIREDLGWVMTDEMIFA